MKAITFSVSPHQKFILTMARITDTLAFQYNFIHDLFCFPVFSDQEFFTFNVTITQFLTEASYLGTSLFTYHFTLSPNSFQETFRLSHTSLMHHSLDVFENVCEKKAGDS